LDRFSRIGEAVVESLLRQVHHYETRAVLVVDREKKPLGILSEKDLVRFAAIEKILPSSMKVSGIMSSHLTIDVNAPVDKVGRELVGEECFSTLCHE